MPQIDHELRRAVKAWITDDPDPETRDELETLLQQNDVEGLHDRFRGLLKFGTAGLRGLLGAGPSRMNRSVVIRATAGLCAWVKQQVPDAAERGVCIGYDGRRMSRELAEDAARVVVGAGLLARAFRTVVPTPLLAYSVLHRRAAAGVMITASHNPPAYNGYKVYWENGAQIIPPHDQGISESIRAVDAVVGVPLGDLDAAEAHGMYEVLGDSIRERYLERVAALAVHPETPRDLSIAYTALHGVGESLVRDALAQAGFESVYSVAEQAQPDGTFPTVDFPNPEEAGAMDLVLDLARKHAVDVVFANDPDADRLAVSVRDDDGEYVALNGNEIGCLFAHYLLENGEGSDRLVISSVVSSPWLGAIAEAHGAEFRQTLTGFKWIANEAIRLERTERKRFVCGYEEALGYTVGTLVRDKDGVSAVAVMADAAAWCKSRGRTLLDERDAMWRRYGMFLSRLVAITMPGTEGADRIAEIMDGIRRDVPETLGGFTVEAVSDLSTGQRRPRDGEPQPLEFPTADVLMLDLAGQHRVMLRPSGTEPKIKFYFDVRVDVAAGESTDDAQQRGEKVLDAIVGDFRAVVNA
jgi:phosphomannomutase